jgi:prevent-host-death family protein
MSYFEPHNQPPVLEIGQDPAGATDLGQCVPLAVRAAQAGRRITVTDQGRPVAVIVPCTRQDDGPDRFCADVYADSYPALIEAAEAEARGFYGPDARLAVERVGTVHSTRSSRGSYTALVIIRCTTLPEGWDVP